METTGIDADSESTVLRVQLKLDPRPARQLTRLLGLLDRGVDAGVSGASSATSAALLEVLQCPSSAALSAHSSSVDVTATEAGATDASDDGDVPDQLRTVEQLRTSWVSPGASAASGVIDLLDAEMLGKQLDFVIPVAGDSALAGHVHSASLAWMASASVSSASGAGPSKDLSGLVGRDPRLWWTLLRYVAGEGLPPTALALGLDVPTDSALGACEVEVVHEDELAALAVAVRVLADGWSAWRSGKL
jgi:hypothetical protein